MHYKKRVEVKLRKVDIKQQNNSRLMKRTRFLLRIAKTKKTYLAVIKVNWQDIDHIRAE